MILDFRPLLGFLANLRKFGVFIAKNNREGKTYFLKVLGVPLLHFFHTGQAGDSHRWAGYWPSWLMFVASSRPPLGAHFLFYLSTYYLPYLSVPIPNTDTMYYFPDLGPVWNAHR